MVLILGVTMPLAALAAPPPTLTGERLVIETRTRGLDFTYIEASCDPAGTSTVTYTRQGIAQGPYPGTYFETGTYVIGPQVLPPRSSPLQGSRGWPTGPVLSFEADFTINSPGYTVTGTKSMVTPSSSNYGTCRFFTQEPIPVVGGQVGDGHSAHVYVANAEYHAVINDAFEDSGTSAVYFEEHHYAIENGNETGTADNFEETYNSALNEPVPLNTSPQVATPAPDTGTEEGSPLTNGGAFSDPDGDPLELSCTCPLGAIASDPDGSWSWSATPPDGPASYTITVTATDPSGASAEDSFNVVVSNVAPSVGPVSAPVEPQPVGTTVTATASFSDPGVLDTHTAVWDWGDGSSTPGTVSESNGSGTVSGTHIYTEAGVYTLTLLVTDKDGDSDSSEFKYLVVYDPSGGFVTGGGWIIPGGGSSDPGDVLPGLDGSSKANFGFVVKYQTGASTVPGGSLEFHYNVGGLHLQSTAMDWLVVTNINWAHFQGTATIDGSPDLYSFRVDARDAVDGDRFVIKIWASADDPDTDDPIYKASGNLQGGQIKIHN